MLELIKKNKGIIVICVLYGIILFIIFTLIVGDTLPSVDGYNILAKHLLSDSFFSYDGVNAQYNRTPGYPFFLVAIYFFCGDDRTVVIIQILLTLINVYLFYRILIMLSVPKRLSLLGTILSLCYLSAVSQIFTIQSETLFGFFLLLSLYFFVCFIKNKNLWVFFGFCLSLNYALFVRTILLYFNILVCFALLVAFIFKKMQLKYFVLFILCFIIVFGGWSYRNYVHSGVFVFSTAQQDNKQRYYAPFITARIKGIPLYEGATEYHREMFMREYSEVESGNLNEAQIAVLRGKYGSQFIRNNLSEYIMVNINGFLNEMLAVGFDPNRTRQEYKRGRLLFLLESNLYWLSQVYIYIVYSLCLISLCIAFKKRDTIQISIFLLCGYLSVPGAIFGDPRYRDPFFPLLLLGAISNSGIIIHWLSAKLHIPILQRIENYLLS